MIKSQGYRKKRPGKIDLLAKNVEINCTNSSNDSDTCSPPNHLSVAASSHKHKHTCTQVVTPHGFMSYVCKSDLAYVYVRHFSCGFGKFGPLKPGHLPSLRETF